MPKYIGNFQPKKPTTADLLAANQPGYYGRIADLYAERGGFPHPQITPPRVQQGIIPTFRQGFNQIGRDLQGSLDLFSQNMLRNLSVLGEGFHGRFSRANRFRNFPTPQGRPQNLIQLGGTT